MTNWVPPYGTCMVKRLVVYGWLVLLKDLQVRFHPIIQIKFPETEKKAFLKVLFLG